MLSRRRGGRQSVLGAFLLAMIAVATMAAGAGYLIGISGRDGGGGGGKAAFSAAQQEFMFGLVTGTQLRDQHPQPVNLRSACAGRFYPTRPTAMAGCIAALSDAPAGGYRLP